VTAMTRDTVAIASDHAGYALKEALKVELVALGHQVLDLGTHGTERVDYPDFGHAMGSAIEKGEALRGVLVCGTGIGISMAANHHSGVRAAVCHDTTTARLSRAHNDANVLALGARIVGTEVAIDCLKVFLGSRFEGGRHKPRVDKI